MELSRNKTGEASYGTFDGINSLRWYFAMIGQPKTDEPPPRLPFEQAFGLAVGTKDPGTFECLCPQLVFHPWDAQRLLTATPAANRGRLRLAIGIAKFYLNYSRRGIPDGLALAGRLEEVERAVATEGLENDPWNEPAPDAPPGYFNTFYEPYGLKVIWPLADFIKQYKWSLTQYYNKISQNEPTV
jgi:hypothetical protein